ncbi:hypothetical protein G4B88_014417 [Cannabis sativa]|uniref:RNase H type-1 domain-containing protein n=1 Tax=Cannabis sativa TaxID=3483 RepID=A0A7J6IA64_CANSA|nr:hypothetical protein G4B88_014417 [Cannabis sativa]
MSLFSLPVSGCSSNPLPCGLPSLVELRAGNLVNIFVDAAFRDNAAFFEVLVLDSLENVVKAFASKEQVCWISRVKNGTARKLAAKAASQYFCEYET